MLTNDQCIEVAEKVWWWKCKPHEDRGWYTFSEIDKFNYEYTYPIDWLRDEVNSWTGFGRTVEAMAGKGYAFSCDDGVVYFIKYGDQWEGFYGVSPFKNFIEATHLAALEAMKDD